MASSGRDALEPIGLGPVPAYHSVILVGRPSGPPLSILEHHSEEAPSASVRRAYRPLPRERRLAGNLLAALHFVPRL
jgi:hypothetical protein